MGTERKQEVESIYESTETDTDAYIADSPAFCCFISGITAFSMLLSSGVKSTMESNAVNLDSYMVENSEVILENAMIEQWSAIRKESAYLNQELTNLLQENGKKCAGF